MSTPSARYIVADASVVLKWFRQEEPLSPAALALLRRHLTGEVALCAPDILLYEVSNVLVHKPDIDEEQLLTFLSDLRSLRLSIVPVDWGLLNTAVLLSARYSVPHRSPGPTVYDASYVALAESLDCEFVTADQRLLSRLGGHPLVRLLSADIGGDDQ